MFDSVRLIDPQIIALRVCISFWGIGTILATVKNTVH